MNSGQQFLPKNVTRRIIEGRWWTCSNPSLLQGAYRGDSRQKSSIIDLSYRCQARRPGSVE
jgi:hypothetical protein